MKADAELMKIGQDYPNINLQDKQKPAQENAQAEPQASIETFKEVMGDTALFFKSNDIKSLERVINYCSNNNLHQQWVKQFNHIKKYDIDKLINKWISIYMHS